MAAQIAYLALLVVGLAVHISYIFATLERSPDFLRFYVSAQHWLAGAPMYGNHNLNPPHFHLIVAPLTALPARYAYAAWTLLSVVSGVVVLRMAATETRINRWIVLVVLCWSATVATIALGQVAMLMAVPMTIVWRASRREQWGLAGACLGLCLAVKPFVGLLALVWAVQQHWRACLACAASWCAVTALGLLVFGEQPYRDWLLELRQVGWDAHYLNASILGFVGRVTDASNPIFMPVVPWPDVARAVWVVCATVIAIVTVLRTRHSDSDHTVAAAVLAALLISPLGWNYYWWLAIGPIVTLVTRDLAAKSWHSDASLMLVLLSLIPPKAAVLGQPNAVLTVTLGSLWFWVTLAAWAMWTLVRLPKAWPPSHGDTPKP